MRVQRAPACLLSALALALLGCSDPGGGSPPATPEAQPEAEPDDGEAGPEGGDGIQPEPSSAPDGRSGRSSDASLISDGDEDIAQPEPDTDTPEPDAGETSPEGGDGNDTGGGDAGSGGDPGPTPCSHQEDCSVADPCLIGFCDVIHGICDITTNPECPPNHPCQVSTSPGSKDLEVAACVCAQEPFCCNLSWDQKCVQTAQKQCDVFCGCDYPGADIACTEDADCDKCGPPSTCGGTWSCDKGECTNEGAITCEDPDPTDCRLPHCVEASGNCGVLAKDILCDDEDPCTTDTCELESGDCQHTLIEGCLECDDGDVPAPSCAEDLDCTICKVDDPCLGPWTCQEGSCALGDPVACDASEDSGCVQAHCNPVTGACELGPWDAACDDGEPCTADTCDAETKDCTYSPAESCDCSVKQIACAAAADCAFCDDGDKCNGAWTCSEAGACIPTEAVACDASGDVGCATNGCDPPSGECVLAPHDDQCDDGEPCTQDTCDSEGACTFTPLSNCGAEPPYACKGAGQAAAVGCDTVAVEAGCCDPWGRLVWCKEGETFCIDCTLLSPPSCGWLDDQAFYDCNEEGEDPSGEVPLLCPAYAP